MTGKLALITGASRGIGEAIAEQLSKQGFGVVGTATHKNHFTEVCDDWIELDFRNNNSVAAAQHHISSLNCDVLINNAGINIIQPADTVDMNSFKAMFDIHVAGALAMTQAVLPNMLDRCYGRIVNIASIWSVVTRPGRVSYSTMKSGLLGLTRTLAVEYGHCGVLVNAVSPGFIETELTRSSLSQAELDELKTRIPLGRLGDVWEIANLVSWLCSDENTYVTGQNIVADGGFVNV